MCVLKSPEPKWHRICDTCFVSEIYTWLHVWFRDCADENFREILEMFLKAVLVYEVGSKTIRNISPYN